MYCGPRIALDETKISLKRLRPLVFGETPHDARAHRLRTTGPTLGSARLYQKSEIVRQQDNGRHIGIERQHPLWSR
jgi:hypothetical protein